MGNSVQMIGHEWIININVYIKNIYISSFWAYAYYINWKVTVSIVCIYMQ